MLLYPFEGAVYCHDCINIYEGPYVHSKRRNVHHCTCLCSFLITWEPQLFIQIMHFFHVFYLSYKLQFVIFPCSTNWHQCVFKLLFWHGHFHLSCSPYSLNFLLLWFLFTFHIQTKWTWNIDHPLQWICKYKCFLNSSQIFIDKQGLKGFKCGAWYVNF